MKLLRAACVAFTLLLASASAFDSSEKSEDSEDQLICVDSPVKECYPKVFKPSVEWQIVKEGQQIPKGKFKM